jgi:hypothetical protein
MPRTQIDRPHPQHVERAIANRRDVGVTDRRAKAPHIGDVAVEGSVRIKGSGHPVTSAPRNPPPLLTFLFEYSNESDAESE